MIIIWIVHSVNTISRSLMDFTITVIWQIMWISRRISLELVPVVFKFCSEIEGQVSQVGPKRDIQVGDRIPEVPHFRVL